MSAVGQKSFLINNIGTGGVVTVPFDVSNYDDISFLFCNDSGGNLSAVLQMTNQPPNGDAAMPSRLRDDSLASYDWTANINPTAQAVSVSGIASGTSASVLVSCQAFKAVRFKLTSANTSNVRVYAFASGTPS